MNWEKMKSYIPNDEAMRVIDNDKYSEKASYRIKTKR